MLNDLEFIGIAFCVVMFLFFEISTEGESTDERD